MSDNGTAGAAAAVSTPVTTGGAGAGAPATAVAPGTGAPKAVATPAGQPKQYDVKVDGKVIRMTEAELLQNASLGKAAFKRMEEAQQVRTKAESFMKQLEADPFGAIDKLNIPDSQKRAMLEKYYSERYIASDQMTPEQKELAELKKWRAEREDSDKKTAEKTEAERKEARKAHYVEQYQAKILGILDKGGLPRDAYTVGRMAYHMQNANSQKIELSDEQLVEAVRNDDQSRFSHYSKEASAEQLITLLGPDAVKKIQKYALEQHRNKLKEAGDPIPSPRTQPRAEGNQARPKIGGVQAGEDGWRKATKYFTRHDK